MVSRSLLIHIMNSMLWICSSRRRTIKYYHGDTALYKGKELPTICMQYRCRRTPVSMMSIRIPDINLIAYGHYAYFYTTLNGIKMFVRDTDNNDRGSENWKWELCEC